MITYKTFSVAEAFREASQDVTWNKAEQAAVDCFDPTPEPLSDSFLAEHAEAIVKECATASWMQKGSA